MWLIRSLRAIRSLHLNAAKDVVPFVEMQSTAAQPLTGLSKNVRALVHSIPDSSADIKGWKPDRTWGLNKALRVGTLADLPAGRSRLRRIVVSELTPPVVFPKVTKKHTQKQRSKGQSGKKRLQATKLQELPSSNSGEHSTSKSDRRQRKTSKSVRPATPPALVSPPQPSFFQNPPRMADGRQHQGKRKRKNQGPESEWRGKLDWCTKQKDVSGALSLVQEGVDEGYRFQVRHFNQVLYLCAAAALGETGPGIAPAQDGAEVLNRGVEVSEGIEVSLGVEKAKDQSGSSGMPVQSTEAPSGSGAVVAMEVSSGPVHTDGLPVGVEGANGATHASGSGGAPGGGGPAELVAVGIQKGWELYDLMQKQDIAPNEATFTSMARIAAVSGDGDRAFALVKQMSDAGIAGRLRSYGPTLAAFAKAGRLEDAFEVDAHMAAAGVEPLEAELASLLHVATECGAAGRVYELLHRLRVTVKVVSPETIAILERWFSSKAASTQATGSFSREEVKAAAENATGGGWHGKGWLGTGAWTVTSAKIPEDGICSGSGETLAAVDLDPTERERFAAAVARLACEREQQPDDFKTFQRWLDAQGDIFAVVDCANVALYKRIFADGSMSWAQVDTVMTGMKDLDPEARWPLLVLHQRRTKDAAATRALKPYREASSFYPTPYGSNDDWYWLYAAVKKNCYLVTNDEMRDHIFQLLGDNFFPKWKERHQVRFTMHEKGDLFQLPPPFSTCIQESLGGSWYFPIRDSDDWLCCYRPTLLEQAVAT